MQYFDKEHNFPQITGVSAPIRAGKSVFVTVHTVLGAFNVTFEQSAVHYKNYCPMLRRFMQVRNYNRAKRFANEMTEQIKPENEKK
jgi:hypothetical protein